MKKRNLNCLLLLVFLLTFSIASPASAVVSDDFSSTTLNTGLWTFVNPLNDTELSMSGRTPLYQCPAGLDTMPGQMG